MDVLFHQSTHASDNDVKFTSLRVESCDGDVDWFNITQLAVSPYPVALDKVISVKLTLDVLQDIDTPLAANVTMKIKTGGSWLDVPCFPTVEVGLDLGSCHYEDLCSFFLLDICAMDDSDACQLLKSSCPYTSMNDTINCQTCPINKGIYSIEYYLNLQDFQRAFVFPGEYWFKMEFYTDNMYDCIEFFPIFN